ncbi:putative multi-domain containing protein [Aduncisulcus paluster]|uniref:Multi-domain containing protein n=1 Tax=Aduncisulcus paluster TaxID=2918883 RepID=A0ABQ5KUP8_9EUKA|nr:putative multi-domain containing protein [Aduncisulcus paluster]|eukprot:gnl/Carplike_NY0171/3855_a5201_469.p1 GENE.gnl/Carplike_NY0171/3855_a5201_469~~gnl/Carplike_NY0171/3855_a5201_469.p1  ORF type:complete len:236 (-),score=42.58 gnl/Carplike_NY0171/3855_a5201_469:119-826(-)
MRAVRLKRARANIKAKRETSSRLELEQMELLCKNLKSALEKHTRNPNVAKMIKKNPELRSKFCSLCYAVGIDPVSLKSGYLKALGLGDFYGFLSSRVATMCAVTAERTGGIIPLPVLVEKLNKGQSDIVTEEDVERCIEKLKIFESGLDIITHPGSSVKLVQSIPREISGDHSLFISQCEAKKINHGTIETFCSILGWDKTRCERVINEMMQNGDLMLDSVPSHPDNYWIMALSM